MKLHYRIWLVIGLVLVSSLFLIPSLVEPLPSWWPAVFPKEKIRLGLDLQGGIHLILHVEVEKALENALSGMGEDLKRELRAKELATVSIKRVDQRLHVKLLDADKVGELREILADRFPTLQEVSDGATEPSEVVLGIEGREAQRIRQFAVEQSLETIRNRVDQYGVREPVIQRSGEESILIQLPGIQDPGRAKELIGKTAQLEFKLLATSGSPDQPPPGTEVIYGQERDPLTGQIHRHLPYVVEKKVLMTGEVIADARARPGTQLEGPSVDLTLNSRGARIFDELTGANVGRRLAIILDNTVYSAPVIRERIGGGRATINGLADVREAHDLAIVLRAGALPAPVTLSEERAVGPTLGRDSIRQGLFSFAVGFTAVVAFMIFYYRLAGVLADLALVMNVFFLLAALAVFGATLTLPGIAGIVLTLGMAVDANVLINERIREELRQSKTPRAAIEAGYERALPAILDSNITTFLSGLILLNFGSGPVKGFAVTLCIGIVTSVFTAVVGTRIVYDYLLQRRRLDTVSI